MSQLSLEYSERYWTGNKPCRIIQNICEAKWGVIQKYCGRKDNCRSTVKEMASYGLTRLSSTLDLEVDFGLDCKWLSVRHCASYERYQRKNLEWGARKYTNSPRLWTRHVKHVMTFQIRPWYQERYEPSKVILSQCPKSTALTKCIQACTLKHQPLLPEG